MSRHLRGVYGKPLAKRHDTLVTPELLAMMGKAFVKHLSAESKKEFAKRGWSGRDPMGGPKIWDSFSVDIHASSIVVKSSFYGMRELTTTGIPERKMTWLTQEGQPQRDSIGRGSTGGKAGRKHGHARLIVPLENDIGQVIFRTAPLTTKDAWVHPGIAKFSFVQRALKKAHAECAQIVGDALVERLKERLKS